VLRVLKKKFRGINEQIKELYPYHDRLSQLKLRLNSLHTVKWFIEYKDHIASYLYLIWILGCAYWLYQLIITDAQPVMSGLMQVDDARDAVIFIFFGMFGLIYLTFFAVFIIKFIFNIIRGGIQSIFSTRWYSLVKSITLLMCLNFAFLYIENIKVAGLTAYTQVAQIVHSSNNHTVVVENDSKDVSRLLELIGGTKQE
jgi:hypothetical protein